jgi:hypothetical protein
MKILVAGLAIKDKEAIVNAIKASSPEDIAAEILELNEEKLAAEDSHSVTKQDLADALDLNETHQSTIEELSKLPKTIVDKAVDKAASFVKEGVEYLFSLPAVLHNGVRITPTEVMADTALQDELIKIKSGMITAK